MAEFFSCGLIGAPTRILEKIGMKDEGNRGGLTSTSLSWSTASIADQNHTTRKRFR
jgi:hypothetical protein